MDKKVLIVSHTFPPDSDVGALRPGSFAKYLPLFGWKPYALTRDVRYIETIDYDLQRQMEKYGTIYSTSTLPHPMQWYRSLKSTIGKLKATKIEHPLETSKRNHSPVRDTLLKILVTFLYIPDAYWGWIPYAVPRGIRIIRTKRIPIIYSTAPPWTCHIVGLFLKSITNCFWIAEFRDPWSQNPQNNADSILSISRRLDRAFEALILNKADKVLCVTDELVDRFNQIYKNRFKNKIKVITNGYDQEEFDRIQRYEGNNRKFTITYTGDFYGPRSPLSFLEAIRELIVENEMPPDDMLIRFVGSCETIKGRPLTKIIDEMGLSDLVAITGRVRREKSLKYVMHSDALLLVPLETELQIPVKFYEYLATGNPILALATEGATKNIILKTGSGLVIQPNDIPGLKMAIKSLYDKWKMDELPKKSPENFQLYERKKLAGHFAGLLEQTFKELKIVQSH